MALDEAVAADGHVVVRQGGAVVGLGVGRGGQRHRALADGQGAILRCNFVIPTKHFPVLVVDHNAVARNRPQDIGSCVFGFADDSVAAQNFNLVSLDIEDIAISCFNL